MLDTGSLELGGWGLGAGQRKVVKGRWNVKDILYLSLFVFNNNIINTKSFF